MPPETIRKLLPIPGACERRLADAERKARYWSWARSSNSLRGQKIQNIMDLLGGRRILGSVFRTVPAAC